MKPAQLLRAVGLPTEGAPDAIIRAIEHNSAKASPGSLFVCIRGARSDGHRYAPEAYARGCRFFLAEQELSLPDDATVWIVPNTHTALGLAASEFYGNPSRSMTVIGITGTKGKTTTALMLEAILNQSGIPTGYIGTNGIRYGSVERTTENTTPDALILQRALADFRDAGCRAAILEVSSQALLLDRVAGTAFDAAIFTNLFHDHVGPGEHPSEENYFACKHRLFTEFGIHTAICNADDPATGAMLSGTSARRIVSCGCAPGAEYRLGAVSPIREDDRLGVSFSIEKGNKKISCNLPLIGTANASNALLSVACAEEIFGILPESSSKILSGISMPGRSEVLRLANGTVAVIDYAHNAASLRQLLAALRAYRPRRLICLFGSVGDRTALRRAELGAVAAELADLCVLTSDNPGTEPPENIIAEIAAAFDGTGTPYLAIPNREEAIRAAVAESGPGDILALAGKGHESYQLIGKQKVPFSEREILLSACGAALPQG